MCDTQHFFVPDSNLPTKCQINGSTTCSPVLVEVGVVAAVEPVELEPAMLLS